jgi:hypothetical protein
MAPPIEVGCKQTKKESGRGPFVIVPSQPRDYGGTTFVLRIALQHTQRLFAKYSTDRKDPPMPRSQSFWPSTDSILRTSALLFASSALVWGASCPAQGQTIQGAIPSAALDFGVFPVNGSSPTQSMTFVFQQTETLSLVRVGAAGIHGVEFKNLGGTCQVGSTYSQNQQCTVELAFRPTFVGDLHGYVSLSDTTGHVIATGFVHGVGGGSQLIFPPGAGQQVGNIPAQFLATGSAAGSHLHRDGELQFQPERPTNGVMDQLPERPGVRRHPRECSSPGDESVTISPTRSGMTRSPTKCNVSDQRKRTPQRAPKAPLPDGKIWQPHLPRCGNGTPSARPQRQM